MSDILCQGAEPGKRSRKKARSRIKNMQDYDQRAIRDNRVGQKTCSRQRFPFSSTVELQGSRPAALK